MSSKAKIILIAVIIFVTILIAVFYLGKKSEEPQEYSLPSDEAAKAGKLSEKELQVVKETASKIFAELSSKGLTTDYKPFQTMLAMNDRNFVAVVNDVNVLAKNAGLKADFYQLLLDEKAIWGWEADGWYDTKKRMLTRTKTLLNIKD